MGKLGFVAGLIETSKLFQFERTLFKATRGNIFLKHSEVGSVVDPSTGEKVEKQVFVVFFSGERIKSKIDKVNLNLNLKLIYMNDYRYLKYLEQINIHFQRNQGDSM